MGKRARTHLLRCTGQSECLNKLSCSPCISPGERAAPMLDLKGCPGQLKGLLGQQLHCSAQCSCVLPVLRCLQGSRAVS